tara:strand:+ start:480 stop:1187 length:708 start_codon:yes stop_codon:yes gene_type:complete
MAGFQIKQGSKLSKNVTKDNISSLLGFGGGGAASVFSASQKAFNKSISTHMVKHLKKAGVKGEGKNLGKAVRLSEKTIKATTKKSKSSNFTPHLFNVERGIKNLEKGIKKMPSPKASTKPTAKAKGPKGTRINDLFSKEDLVVGGIAATIGGIGVAGMAGLVKKAKDGKKSPPSTRKSGVLRKVSATTRQKRKPLKAMTSKKLEKKSTILSKSGNVTAKRNPGGGITITGKPKKK